MYILLGGNRVPGWRRDLNVLIVFLASGLWHGAAGTFVFWGLLHSIYLVVERRSKNTFDRIASALHFDDAAVRRTLGTVVTFLLVSFAWIFFYARSIPDALLLFQNLVCFGGGTDIFAPWASLTNVPVIEMALAWGLIGLLFLTHLGRAGLTPWVSRVTGKAGVHCVFDTLKGVLSQFA